MKTALLVPLVLSAALAFLLFRPAPAAPPYKRPPLPTPVVLDEMGALPPGVQVTETGPRPSTAGDGLRAWR
jgi:hypothetical protein